MNYSTAVFLINKHVRAIVCTYEAEEKAPRTVFKTLDTSIATGDFVTVPTDTRHKMTVVKVVDTDVDVDFDSGVQIQWVIGKVDRTDYEQVLAQEAVAIQTIKQAEVRKKREDLSAALLANSADALKALPISSAGEEEAPQA